MWCSQFPVLSIFISAGNALHPHYTSCAHASVCVSVCVSYPATHRLITRFCSLNCLNVLPSHFSVQDDYIYIMINNFDSNTLVQICNILQLVTVDAAAQVPKSWDLNSIVACACGVLHVLIKGFSLSVSFPLVLFLRQLFTSKQLSDLSANSYFVLV